MGTPEEEHKIAKITDQPPDWMDAETQALWVRCATPLYARGILVPVNRFWLALFCDTYSQIRQARRKAQETQSKKERAIYIEIQAEAEPMLREMFQEMGFKTEEEFENFLRMETQ
jgi:phage terminase small subunit